MFPFNNFYTQKLDKKVNLNFILENFLPVRTNQRETTLEKQGKVILMKEHLVSQGLLPFFGNSLLLSFFLIMDWIFLIKLCCQASKKAFSKPFCKKMFEVIWPLKNFSLQFEKWSLLKETDHNCCC